MRHKMPREFYIPPGAVKVADKLSDAVAYLYTNVERKPCARVFFGKQSTPVVRCYYRSEAERESAVTRAFAGRREWKARNVEAQAKRKAFIPTFKVGDIFRTSWGYDQTNVEFFEIVEIKKKMAVLRGLKQARVETSSMVGICAPLPGDFIAEDKYDGAPITRLMQDGRIKIDDVRTAWPVEKETVAGVEVVKTSSWTAYA